jgi:hypothetical protein
LGLDHATAGRELALQHHLRGRVDRVAAFQHDLRRALDDDLPAAVIILDEHG